MTNKILMGVGVTLALYLYCLISLSDYAVCKMGVC